jgi:hypothetical protein
MSVALSVNDSQVSVLFCTDFLIAGGVERQLTELVARLDSARFR